LRLGGDPIVRCASMWCAIGWRRGQGDLLGMAKGKAKRKIGAGDVASTATRRYRYELIERFECGIVLEGTEVKSLRVGRPAEGRLRRDQGRRAVAALGVYIPPYAPASRENHDPERPRKLLLHRRELDRSRRVASTSAG
jgi:SsrA-binding protein